MASRIPLLIATSNGGKAREMQDYLARSVFELLSLNDLPAIPIVEETGSTFAQNAALKASAYAVHAGKLAVADDSGLEVSALGNRPGVQSARYGGDGLDYGEKIRMLLNEIELSGSVDRSARFVCAMSVAGPDGRILHESMGVCSGTIGYEPRGQNGFGYDPVFIPDDYELTFGQLSSNVKRQISHRARALQQIIPFLRHFNID
jgi:XTP/dITP diphosphohydrolase